MEFRKHQQDAVNTFNDAVKHHNPDYQAATAILNIEGLDTDSGKLPLSINWKLWAKQLDREGCIIVPNNKAETLLKEGKQKPIYVYLNIVEGVLKINKIFLTGLGVQKPAQPSANCLCFQQVSINYIKTQ